MDIPATVNQKRRDSSLSEYPSVRLRARRAVAVNRVGMLPGPSSTAQPAIGRSFRSLVPQIATGINILHGDEQLVFLAALTNQALSAKFPATKRGVRTVLDRMHEHHRQ